MGKVWFIGAGPGAPDLLTVRGARLIGEADVVIWARSLVNEGILEHARPGAEIFESTTIPRRTISPARRARAVDGRPPAVRATRSLIARNPASSVICGCHSSSVRAREMSGKRTWGPSAGIASWMKRVEDLPGYERTVPPHWKEKPAD